MRLLLFALAAIALTACGPSEAVLGGDELPETTTEDAELTRTPPSTLVLAQPGARVVAATADRSRVVVKGTPDANDCAGLFLVDAQAKTSKSLGGERLFCGPFTLTPALSGDGRRLATWAYAQATNTWTLYLWDEAQPSFRAIASRVGHPETNELDVLAFTSDGRHLVFVPAGNGTTGYALWTWSVEAAQATRISLGASLVKPRFSPDGARVAFLAQDKVLAWTFSTKTLTTLGIGHDYTLQTSPDASRLVFTAGCVDAGGENSCELREWSFTAAAPRVVARDVRESFGFAAKAPVLAYRTTSGIESWNAVTQQRSTIPGACWAGLSGDGLQLAWLANCNVPNAPVGELRVGTSSSSKRVASNVARGGRGFEPLLNLDGTRLTYTSGTDLMLWGSSSLTPRRVASDNRGSFSGESGSHGFSPDGRVLVFEKTTSWVNPFLCPPYGRCGYRDLIARDVSSSYGSDRTMASGASYSSDRYNGLVGGEWGTSPDGTLLAYVSESFNTVRLNALASGSRTTWSLARASGSASGGLSALLGDGFAVVVDARGVSVVTGLR